MRYHDCLYYYDDDYDDHHHHCHYVFAIIIIIIISITCSRVWRIFLKGGIVQFIVCTPRRDAASALEIPTLFFFFLKKCVHFLETG